MNDYYEQNKVQDAQQPLVQRERRSVELKKGPLENRGCTDVICCLIFLAFWVGIGFIAYLGFRDGNPVRLATPFDGSGNQCGVTAGFEDYEMIYFVEPISHEYLYRTVCVKSCPNWADGTGPDSLDCKTNTVVDSCDKKSGVPGQQVQIYKTSTFADKMCLPVETDIFDMILDVISQSRIDEFMRDLLTAKYIIVIGFLICFGLGFLWMYLVRLCSGFIVWLIIIIYFLTLGALGYFFFSKFYNFSDAAVQDPDAASETTYKWLFYITCGVFLLSLIFIACCFSRIRLVTAILETASEFVTDVPSVLSVPPIIWVSISVFFTLWLIIALFLYSSGHQITPEPQSMLPFGQYDMDTTARYLFLVHLFGLFWGIAWLLSLSQFIIASAACMWYFTKTRKPRSPVCRSLGRGIFWHTGTLAFGSFLIACVWFVQSILAYMEVNYY